MKTAWKSLATILLLTTTVAAAGPLTWEFRDGRWQQIQSPTTKPILHDAELDRIEQILAGGEWKAAHLALVQWLKDHPTSPLRDRGLYIFAQVYYQGDDRIRAYYHLDELLDNYPDSRFFYPALDMQYKIADEYLNGHNDTFLGMSIISREGEAIEMLYRLQQRSPGSPLAEKALLRTADYYYSDLQYDLASDAYNIYAKTYPRSPAVPKVKLRRAFSSLAQFRGTKFDPTPLINARAQLVDIGEQYPQLAEEENVAVVIEKIDSTFANKLYVTADFYRRTHVPDGAVYTYRTLIKQYPTSPEAGLAKKWLQKMPPSSLALPEPSNNEGFNVTGGPIDPGLR